MAQKSLPILNKVGTSMIWFTTFYYKHYKWLSSQTLYLLFFFNKLFVYLDYFFAKPLFTEKFHLIYKVNLKKKRKVKQSLIKFFKPVTAYLIRTGNTYTIINLFYKNTLETFQGHTLELYTRQKETPISASLKQPKLFYKVS